MMAHKRSKRAFFEGTAACETALYSHSTHGKSPRRKTRKRCGMGSRTLAVESTGHVLSSSIREVQGTPPACHNNPKSFVASFLLYASMYHVRARCAASEELRCSNDTLCLTFEWLQRRPTDASDLGGHASALHLTPWFSSFPHGPALNNNKCFLCGFTGANRWNDNVLYMWPSTW